MNYYLLVISVSLFIFLIILYSTKKFKKIDKSIKYYFIGKRSNMKTKIYIVITHSIILAVIILLLSLLLSKNYHKLLVISIMLIIGNILGNLIKVILKRERPLEKLVKETDYSFPSMHSLNGTLTYGVSVMLLGPIYLLIFIPLIVLTGISRLYLGVHYFTDIIGGLAIGLFILSIVGVFL